jgi:hypothetical protein
MPGDHLEPVEPAEPVERVAPTLLDGKTALVTGSSRGIGRATAVLLAWHGVTVALHGRVSAT